MKIYWIDEGRQYQADIPNSAAMPFAGEVRGKCRSCETVLVHAVDHAAWTETCTEGHEVILPEQFVRVRDGQVEIVTKTDDGHTIEKIGARLR